MDDGRPLHELIVEYILGTLNSRERQAFEGHLLVCDECFAAMQPTTSLVLALPTQQQRELTTETPVALASTYSRWLARIGILVVGAAAGLALGLTLAHTATQSPPPTRVIALSSSPTGAEGLLALYQRPWGTQVHATFHNLPSHGQLRMVVASVYGHVTTMWLGTPHPKVSLQTAIPYRPNAITWVGIYVNNGRLIDSWKR